jgi:peroxiredoxin
MNKNYMKLTSGGVEILAINVGESANKAGKFAKAHKLGYKVLLDRDSRVANSYDVIGVPTYILVNKEGEIAFTGNSYPHKEIDKLISE